MVEVMLEECEKEPPGTEWRQSLKDKEDKEVDYLPKTSNRKHTSQHPDFSSAGVLLDFWSTAMKDSIAFLTFIYFVGMPVCAWVSV